MNSDIPFPSPPSNGPTLIPFGQESVELKSMGQVLDLPSEITLGFNAHNDMLASIDLSTVAFPSCSMSRVLS